MLWQWRNRASGCGTCMCCQGASYTLDNYIIYIYFWRWGTIANETMPIARAELCVCALCGIVCVCVCGFLCCDIMECGKSVCGGSENQTTMATAAAMTIPSQYYWPTFVAMCRETRAALVENVAATPHGPTDGRTGSPFLHRTHTRNTHVVFSVLVVGDRRCCPYIHWVFFFILIRNSVIGTRQITTTSMPSFKSVGCLCVANRPRDKSNLLESLLTQKSD